MFWTTRVIQLLQTIVVLCRKILKAINLREPGMVWIKITDVTFIGEVKMLHFKLVLPPAGAADVVTRALEVKVNDVPSTMVLAGSAIESDELSGDDSATVVGTLVDTDDAGNSSPPRDFSFILTDTLAPPIPGELGLVVTGED